LQRLHRGFCAMNTKRITRTAAKWVAAGVGFAFASYATYAGMTWFRYGNPKRAEGEDGDPLLDVLMSKYEVADRHKIHVKAPAEVTLAAVTEVDLEDCAIIRGIFKGRELILRSKSENVVRPRGLLAQMKFLGWGQLAEVPGREIVMGAVTKPWEA